MSVPTVSRSEIEELMVGILSTERFTASNTLKKILTYVVQEELEGRGERIKGLSIAWDALGKKNDFDPQRNPVVRVSVSRLRSALDAYYNEEGKADLVRIEIPKGSYRPFFHDQRNESDGKVRNTSDGDGIEKQIIPVLEMPKKSIYWPILLSVLIIFSALTFSFWNAVVQTDDIQLGSIGQSHPIIEILPFSSPNQSLHGHALAAFRKQIAADLSHFKNIRVRMTPLHDSTHADDHSGTFQLLGREIPVGEQDKFILILQGAARGDVVWSHVIQTPRTDSEFYSLLDLEVGQIVTQIAGTRGALPREAFARLSDRRKKFGHTQSTNYECVLSFRVFEATRDPVEETYSRACLSRLIHVEKTQDASVWAAWSIMKYFLWTGIIGDGAKDDHTVYAEALAAANKAVRLDSADSTNYHYLGTILKGGGQYEEAMAAYKRAVELNPSNVQVYAAMGWFYFVNGGWENGVAEINKALDKSYETSGWVRIPLSMNAFRKGNYSEALKEAKHVIAAGDQRGWILAYAAAIAMENHSEIEILRSELEKLPSYNHQNPMKKLGALFNDSSVIDEYDRVLSSARTEL